MMIEIVRTADNTPERPAECVMMKITIPRNGSEIASHLILKLYTN